MQHPSAVHINWIENIIHYEAMKKKKKKKTSVECNELSPGPILHPAVNDKGRTEQTLNNVFIYKQE